MKTALLNLIERPVIGAPVRWLGALTRRRPRVLGLTNPFFLPTRIVNHDRFALFAETGSYLAENAPVDQVLRLDPAAFEPEIGWLIDRLVGEDDVVLDIGANVGAHATRFARLAGKGHVFAFEPVAEMAERLSRNVAFNRLDNVTLLPFALGAEDATLDMQVNVAGTGMEGTSSFVGSRHVSDNPSHYEARSLQVKRLDDVIETLGVDGRIGFVKIDTEGFETQVIDGGLKTLREHNPVMIVEAHSTRLAEAGRSFMWYCETLPDHHVFIVSAITRANPYLRIEPLEAEPPEIAVNLLLLPKTVRPGT